MTNCQFIDKDLFISYKYCMFTDMKKLLLIFFLTNSMLLFCQRFETITPGYWYDTNVWLNGNMPGYNVYDTIIINNPIIFDENLTFYSYSKINFNGAICGHNTLNLYNDMDIFGYFQIDSMNRYQGDVLYSSSHFSIVTFYINSEATSPSIWHSINHQGMSVGIDTFDCRIANYLTSKIDEKTLKGKINFHPNPVSNILTIEGDFQNSTFQLIDALGRIVLSNKTSPKLDLSLFEKGIYFLKLIKDEKTIHVQKVIKE